MSGNNQSQAGTSGDDYADLTLRLDTLKDMALGYLENAPVGSESRRAADMRLLLNTIARGIKQNVGNGQCPTPDWIDCGNYCVPPGGQCFNL